MKAATITVTALLAAAGLLAGCGTSAGSSKTSSASQHSARPPTVGASPSRPPTAEVIAARMHLRHVTAYTAATDPNHLLSRQGEYTSKINWAHGDSTNTNSIEVFPSNASLRKRYQLAQAL
jgi:hypothetical protein